MPRSCSWGRRSVFLPVSASTSVVLPWSMCPAVPIVSGMRSSYRPRLRCVTESSAARARLRDLSDFAAPWAVWIAGTLRLADHIEAGTTSLDELATDVHADPDALRRLLAYLVGRGV